MSHVNWEITEDDDYWFRCYQTNKTDYRARSQKWAYCPYCGEKLEEGRA